MYTSVGVKVSDFSGRSLSLNGSVVPNPQIPEALALHNWRHQYPQGFDLIYMLIVTIDKHLSE